MKKVIDGKMYDTDTADLIAKYGNGHYPGDFRYYCAELYLTKNGAFFLYEDGGALSCMGVPCGNNGKDGSEDITAYTADQAIAWAEENGDSLTGEEQTKVYKAAGKKIVQA